MSALIVDGHEVAVICSPPMAESCRKSMGVKWCFTCRQRHEFSWVVMSPTTYDGWWWGPTAHAECGGCGDHDSQLFPGWEYASDEDE